MYVGKRVELVTEDETIKGTIIRQEKDGLLVILYDDELYMDEIYPYQLLYRFAHHTTGVYIL